MSAWKPLELPVTPPEKPRVRVRGVYATALTKLFLDAGFQIVQPSEKIAQRFKLEKKMLSPDVDVYDAEDKQGVVIEVHPRLTERVKNTLWQRLDDALIYRSEFQLHAIYKGIVFRPAPSGGWMVKLTPEGKEGLLPLQEIKGTTVQVEDVVLVQVREIAGMYPQLTTSLTIPGDYVILTLGDTRVHVSHKIRGEERERLLRIGQALKPDEYGLIMRTSAVSASEEQLAEEIKLLVEKAKELLEKAEKAPALTCVREGFDILHVVFPGGSKMTLDEIRAQVYPTVRLHHYFKTRIEGASQLVDFVEGYILANRRADRESVSRDLFRYILDERLPREADVVSLEHRKPDGRIVMLGPATVVKVEIDDSVTWYLFRRFKPGGTYDALKVPKEAGDFGFTIVRAFSDYFVTCYFNAQGQLKGIYVNINTPVEPQPDRFAYFDLEIDVVKKPGEPAQIVEREKLQQYVERGILSKEFADRVMKRAEELKKWLETSGEKELVERCRKLMVELKLVTS